jgi:hypothetical protein
MLWKIIPEEKCMVKLRILFEEQNWNKYNQYRDSAILLSSTT